MRSALCIPRHLVTRGLTPPARQSAYSLAAASVQANSKRTATLPPQETFALRKKASESRSMSSTSMSIVSPGRTMRLNFTSLIRVATGAPPCEASNCFESKIAPACIAASHNSTPGVSGYCG